jgi:F-type H+-transporting ATPase subunit b
MEGLGINPWMLLAQIVSFVLLVVILRAVGYTPIQKMLREREERIARALEEAKAAEEARAKVEAEREEILGRARTEAQEIVADAQRRAREEREKLLAQAREEAEHIRETARQEAEAERAQMLGQMREQIVALSIAAAHKLVGEALDEQRQRALVEAFFSGVREGRVVVLPEEMETRLGTGLDISFRVDPQVLGGLVVRIGDRIVDASFAGQLEQMRRALSA